MMPSNYTAAQQERDVARCKEALVNLFDPDIGGCEPLTFAQMRKVETLACYFSEVLAGALSSLERAGLMTEVQEAAGCFGDTYAWGE